jgi:N-acetylglucosamine kinase-like BadF-type ATPase
MIDLNLIGNRIRELRRQRGLTQIEFAKILSVSFQAVSSWERGITPPDIENLINIASYFGVLVDTLLSPINENLYLGVDGGGTKTEFAVVSASGSVLKRIIKPGCNPNDIGFEKAAEIITSGINDILIEYPTVKSIFCGIAGSSTGNFREKLCAILNKIHPKVETKIQSDAVNLFAICDQADIALISGTGSVALVKSGTGYKRLGGWGYLFDRAGSAYDVGRDAIAEALKEEDTLKKPSAISRMLCKKMNTTSVWEHINALYNGGKSYIASFASLVFDAYQEGDAIAYSIIDKNAQALANLLNEGAALYGVNPIAIANGGLFEHYSDILTHHIKKYSSVNLIVSDLPPIYGACRRSCSIACCQESSSFYENFKKTYVELKK